jgi:hypothetical protein
METEMTEAEVRALRAKVYGECSDKNWECCRERWMEPENVKWLRENVKV